MVILGSGAFACEAMEEAVANNARSVTLVARERRRCCSPLSHLPSTSACVFFVQQVLVIH